jgi:CRP-like cAMP-binding protein
MEHQAAATGIWAESNVVPICTTSRRASIGVSCALPLGKSMRCGDARHREDRAPDSEIIAGGAASHDVWFIRSGILRLQRYGYDGRRHILSLFLPGEIVGFEGEFRNGVGVETVTQSGLCRINRRMFDTMLNDNDELRAEIFRQKQDQLDRLHWLTWSLGVLSPEERYCAFLALSTRFMPFQTLSDGSGVLAMQLPRVDIADLLVTTVETICRINRKLSEAGVIEIKDPTHFRIPDLSRLTSLGRIDATFDRMVRGITERRYRLDRMVATTSEIPTCFCGR